MYELIVSLLNKEFLDRKLPAIKTHHLVSTLNNHLFNLLTD